MRIKMLLHEIICVSIITCFVSSSYDNVDDYYTEYGYDYRESAWNQYNQRIEQEWILINQHLDSNDTQNFLSTFNSTFQRTTLYQQLKHCPYTPLCEYDLFPLRNVTVVDYGQSPCCYPCNCNFPKCVTERTCCLDILFRNGNTTAEDQEKSIKGCSQLYMSKVQSELLAKSVVMYNSCQSDAPEQLKTNCTRDYSPDLKRFMDVAPVFDVATKKLYRNAHCAYCNNISSEHVKEAQLILSCGTELHLQTEHDVIKTVKTTENCTLTFAVEHHLRPVTCPISECNTTGYWAEYDAELEEACAIYDTIIEIGSINYKNIFCAFCNGVEFRNETECIPGSGHHTIAFSGILKLNLHTDSSEPYKEREKNSCTTEQVFDPMNAVCRDLICPGHMSLQNGECVDLYSKVSNVGYTIYLQINALERTTIQKASSLAEHLQQFLRQLFWMYGEICKVDLLYVAEANLKYDYVDDVIYSTLKCFKVRVEVFLQYYHDTNSVIELVMSLNKFETSLTYRDESSNNMKNFDMILQITDGDLQMFNKIFNTASVIGYGSPHIPTEESFSSNIEQNAIQLDTNTVLIPHFEAVTYWPLCLPDAERINILRMLPCPKLELSACEIPWTHTDDGISFIRGTFSLEHSQFYFKDDATVVICSDIFKEYINHIYREEHRPELAADSILSIISTSLSIVCLVITIVVIYRLPGLRQSLPGKNSTCLVLVLLCAQSMWLVTETGLLDAGSTACIVVGMLVHFLWLLSIFWMNVCTYHMFHALTKISVIKHDTTCTCRFVMYHLYAITMSTFPVVVNIAVSISTSGQYGYGDYVCYISSQTMVTYTFGLPVALVILANTCMYLYSIIRIKITSDSGVQKNVQHERNSLLIFVKLSTITGITWVFGFVYSWTDIAVFSYIFIILNATQGVFIMLAFIFNRRVLKMLLDKNAS